MSTLLILIAAFGLLGGVWLVIPSPRPVRAEPVEAHVSGAPLATRPSTCWGRTEEGISPAAYRRRIIGAMLIAASLFLGGFTLTASFTIS